MSVIFNDYSDEVLQAFDEGCLRALERCGLQAEGYAQDLCPVATGNLRNSINHKVDPGEPAAFIGTNTEYAAYGEFGTGGYSSTGGGTPKSHWVYMGSDGEFHVGKPMKPRPYLKPAVANHVGTYRNIIKDELSKYISKIGKGIPFLYHYRRKEQRTKERNDRTWHLPVNF